MYTLPVPRGTNLSFQIKLSFIQHVYTIEMEVDKPQANFIIRSCRELTTTKRLQSSRITQKYMKQESQLLIKPIEDLANDANIENFTSFISYHYLPKGADYIQQ